MVRNLIRIWKVLRNWDNRLISPNWNKYSNNQLLNSQWKQEIQRLNVYKLHVHLVTLRMKGKLKISLIWIKWSMTWTSKDMDEIRIKRHKKRHFSRVHWLGHRRSCCTKVRMERMVKMFRRQRRKEKSLLRRNFSSEKMAGIYQICPLWNQPQT